jgi:hypothetical protein
MNERKRILIGLPSNGFIKTETVSSLLYMMACSPVEYTMFTPMSCYIHMNREKCAQVALEMEADYLLFIDADMIFPEDALIKLLELDKDISSVTYNFREFPKRSVVSLDEKYDSDYIVGDDVTERPIPLEKINNPFRCKSAGTGFMLIKTDVFKNIPRPWFFFEPETDTQGAVGEDNWFCDRAIENDYEIWIDPSIKMGHIGNMVY